MVAAGGNVPSGAQCFQSRVYCVTGFLFLAGSIPLAIGLGFAGVLTVETALHSLLGLGAVLTGFRVGEWLRSHVQQDLISEDCFVGIFVHGYTTNFSKPESYINK